MKKILINPDSMVTPLSKYSHGVRVDIGDAALIFVTGQIAVDSDGNLVGENDMTRQTVFVFEEIKMILEAGGATLSDVVKANVYVTDMSQFDKVAKVRNRYFADSPPASTFVEINKLVRDGCMVEIEVIAVVQK